jgi:hypothetical protein
VAEESAGIISGLKLTTQGTFSGVLVLRGVSHRFSGGFSMAGESSNDIASSSGPLTLRMTNLFGSYPNQIAGAVSAAGWESPVLLIANASGALPSAAYTMLLPPVAIFSGGYGQAVIANHAGLVSFVGKLADGTGFNPAVNLSQSNTVPLYASLHGNSELLTGLHQRRRSFPGNHQLRFDHFETRRLTAGVFLIDSIDNGTFRAVVICCYDTAEASSNRRSRNSPVSWAADAYQRDIQVLWIRGAYARDALCRGGFCGWPVPLDLADVIEGKRIRNSRARRAKFSTRLKRVKAPKITAGMGVSHHRTRAGVSRFHAYCVLFSRIKLICCRKAFQVGTFTQNHENHGWPLGVPLRSGQDHAFLG